LDSLIRLVGEIEHLAGRCGEDAKQEFIESFLVSMREHGASERLVYVLSHAISIPAPSTATDTPRTR
jgi:hypothetical protein